MKNMQYQPFYHFLITIAAYTLFMGTIINAMEIQYRDRRTDSKLVKKLKSFIPYIINNQSQDHKDKFYQIAIHASRLQSEDNIEYLRKNALKLVIDILKYELPESFKVDFILLKLRLEERLNIEHSVDEIHYVAKHNYYLNKRNRGFIRKKIENLNEKYNIQSISTACTRVHIPYKESLQAINPLLNTTELHRFNYLMSSAIYQKKKDLCDISLSKVYTALLTENLDIKKQTILLCMKVRLEKALNMTPSIKDINYLMQNKQYLNGGRTLWLKNLTNPQVQREKYTISQQLQDIDLPFKEYKSFLRFSRMASIAITKKRMNLCSLAFEKINEALTLTQSEQYKVKLLALKLRLADALGYPLSYKDIRYVLGNEQRVHLNSYYVATITKFEKRLHRHQLQKEQMADASDLIIQPIPTDPIPPMINFQNDEDIQKVFETYSNAESDDQMPCIFQESAMQMEPPAPFNLDASLFPELSNNSIPSNQSLDYWSSTFE